jgi:hypothetical protein
LLLEARAARRVRLRRGSPRSGRRQPKRARWSGVRDEAPRCFRPGFGRKDVGVARAEWPAGVLSSGARSRRAPTHGHRPTCHRRSPADLRVGPGSSRMLARRFGTRGSEDARRAVTIAWVGARRRWSGRSLPRAYGACYRIRRGDVRRGGVERSAWLSAVRVGLRRRSCAENLGRDPVPGNPHGRPRIITRHILLPAEVHDVRLGLVRGGRGVTVRCYWAERMRRNVSCRTALS